MMTAATKRRIGPETVLAFALVAALLGSACSSTPQVCKDLDQLQTSVQTLKDVNIGSGTLTTLQSDLSTVQTDLAAVKQSASQAVGPEVTTMTAALQTLRGSIQSAVASPGAASIAAVATAVGATQAAFTSLKAAVPDC